MTAVAPLSDGVPGIDGGPDDDQQLWSIARHMTASEHEADALVAEVRERAERLVAVPEFQQAVRRLAAALAAGDLDGPTIAALINDREDR